MISCTRRITIAEHLAAKERLNPANRQFRIFELPDGSQWYVATGTIDPDDYTRRDGHKVLFAFDGAPFPDRFGWPKGDPRSPESLAA